MITSKELKKELKAEGYSTSVITGTGSLRGKLLVTFDNIHNVYAGDSILDKLELDIIHHNFATYRQ